MGNCLGKESPAASKGMDQDKVDQVTLDLKIQRDHLKRYEQQQEQIQEREIKEAKALARANKRDKAAIVLKQKKLRQVYIDRARGQLQNVQRMIDEIESQRNELEIMECMRGANDVMKEFERLMPIEEVERLMDETAEHQQRLNEMQDLLAQDLTPQDTAAVEDEYEQMLADIDAEDGEGELDEGSEEAPARMALPA
jgi:hypothetical protein